MIPYGKQSIDGKDIRAVESVLKSDWLTQGPKIAEFENALADYCGAKFAVAVSSGTVALHIAYLASGLKAGDEVVTTPNTFVATSNMLLAVGAKPVFCDIHSDTYNIDETKIEKLITKKTRAIAPVHFAGIPCEMDKIMNIARRHKLIVIEDACHALGAKYKNKKIGSIGHMTVLSFHPVKSITTGEGGAILTDNKKYYERLKLLRSHGIYKDKNGKNIMTEMGYNYRITDIQASLGITQLKKLDNFIKKRKQIVSWYKEFLQDCKEIILPVNNPDSANHIYIIRTKKITDRLPLYNFLRNAGVGVNFHYPAVYSHPYYQKIGYAGLKLPMEEAYQNSCVTLPCFPGLSRALIKRIAKSINSFYESR
ncbi:MAG: UDP-4-amino-4,6-dideoxy-N-acetyl-beta-L-altrosamine transaminase [Candidatus Zambryskibacteria bacterium]